MKTSLSSNPVKIYLASNILLSTRCMNPADKRQKQLLTKQPRSTSLNQSSIQTNPDSKFHKILTPLQTNSIIYILNCSRTLHHGHMIHVPSIREPSLARASAKPLASLFICTKLTFLRSGGYLIFYYNRI